MGTLICAVISCCYCFKSVSCPYCCFVPSDFTVNDVKISFHPGPDVTRDTNVTVTCHADVSRSAGFSPKYEFHIEKDNTELHRATGDSDTYNYSIGEARVADTGDYRCRLFIGDKRKNSQKQTLTVTGQTILF